MPRSKRLIPPDAALHIMCRGNNKQNIFHDNSDKLRYYSLIHEFKDENTVRILHYCLMDNHIHLIALLDAQSKLSKCMKQINLSYWNYYQKKYGYSGHLWQDRFKSNIIEADAHLLQCGKYIELNPVRANMADFPQGYAFTSYQYYAYGRQDALITPNPAYLALSDSETKRRKQYIEFVINQDMINSERLIKQAFIGSEYFVKKLQEYYAIRNEKRKRGRPRKGEK